MFCPGHDIPSKGTATFYKASFWQISLWKTRKKTAIYLKNGDSDFRLGRNGAMHSTTNFTKFARLCINNEMFGSFKATTNCLSFSGHVRGVFFSSAKSPEEHPAGWLDSKQTFIKIQKSDTFHCFWSGKFCEHKTSFFPKVFRLADILEKFVDKIEIFFAIWIEMSRKVGKKRNNNCCYCFTQHGRVRTLWGYFETCYQSADTMSWRCLPSLRTDWICCSVPRTTEINSEWHFLRINTRNRLAPVWTKYLDVFGWWNVFASYHCEGLSPSVATAKHFFFTWKVKSPGGWKVHN